MRIYNVSGWLLVVAYALACMYFAPPTIGPWLGLAIGAGYMIASWFVGGVYLSCVIHMGIAHRALDYQPWFLQRITVVHDTVGGYVNTVTGVSCHPRHHQFSAQPGDPNKLPADAFWRTLYLCLMPYECQVTMADDEILKSRPFRLVSHPLFSVVAQVVSFGFIWLLV